MASRLFVPFLRFVGSLLILLAAARGGLAQTDSVEGFTEPYRRIDLAAAEPGLIAELGVREGERVTQGQVLGSLDTSVMEATLNVAQARAAFQGGLQAAQAERDLRQQHWQQLRLLHGRGHATQRELDRAETDYHIAVARLKMVEEDLKMQALDCRRIEAQIQRRRFRSPVNGIISNVYREAGEAILANDPRVATVVQLDRLKVKYSVLPQQSQQLQVGQQITLTLPDSGRKTAGEVESVSPVIDAKSGTVEITIVIDNPQEVLPSGARCLWQLPSSPRGKQTRYTAGPRRE